MLAESGVDLAMAGPSISEFMQIAEWIGISRLRQTVVWQNGQITAILSGLVSGLRATTETNGPLNIAYERVIRAIFRRLFGTDPTANRRAKGDDSFDLIRKLDTSGWFVGVQMDRIAEWVSFEASPNKLPVLLFVLGASRNHGSRGIGRDLQDPYNVPFRKAQLCLVCMGFVLGYTC